VVHRRAVNSAAGKCRCGRQEIAQATACDKRTTEACRRAVTACECNPDADQKIVHVRIVLGAGFA
jgi:hypothetical protein